MKYNKKTLEEFKKVRQSYNAKIKRLENKYVKNLPERKKLSDIKFNYLTNKELKQETQRMKLFLEKGAEDQTTFNGKLTTKYEKARTKYNERLAIRNLKNIVNKYDKEALTDPALRRNLELNRIDEYDKAKAKLRQIKSKRVYKDESLEQYNQILEDYALDNVSKGERFKRNYLRNLQEKFQYYHNPNKKSKIFNLINNTTGEEFDELFEKHGEELSKIIQFIYRDEERFDIEYEYEVEDELDTVYAKLSQYINEIRA